jgi:ribosome biogenesis GTPase
MKLDDIGFSINLNRYLLNKKLDKDRIGRISAVYKDSYNVIATDSELRATITGNFQYSVNNPSELPAVGDWVLLSKYDDGQALITQLLPRESQLDRRSVGKKSEIQIIAANINYGIIVEAVGDQFNLNRIERFVTICNASNIEPIIVINKIDLTSAEDIKELVIIVSKRFKNIPVLAVSNVSKLGLNKLTSILKKGKTYCLLGLSGVGKSTIINNLLGKSVLETHEISSSTKKGVHTTTHRELFLLDNGSIIIDNPGMREIGLTNSEDGLDSTFSQINNISQECQFSNCTHTSEKGCAILLGIEQGVIDQSQYNNYLKMKREQFHFSASIAEKRKKDKKFGKMVKDIMKTKNKKRH